MTNFLEELLFIYPRRFARYRGWIGAAAAFRLMRDELFRRRRTHVVRIKDTRIAIRSLSSDLNVAVDSLFHEEFAGIALQNPSVIVDAGANMGASTLYFAHKYPHATVYAVEPEPDNYRMLVENTKDCNNVIAIQAALWGTDGELTLTGAQGGEWAFTHKR